jgi:ATP-dependent Clp protease ATP-binding subunit ClpA
MIKRSREIALELGYDYISSVHFMFAEIEQDGILKSFLSEKVNDFKALFESARLHSKIEKGDVPLTVEAEKSLRKSNIEAFIHSSNKIEPFHIILASLKIKNSLLTEFLSKLGLYYDDLQKHILKNWYINGHAFNYKWNRFFYISFIRKMIIGRVIVKYDDVYWPKKQFKSPTHFEETDER